MTFDASQHGVVTGAAFAVPVSLVDRATREPRSSKWPSVRDEHLRNHPSCACCGRRDTLNVHHIKPFHLFPDLELVPSNFLTLCEYQSLNCHLFMGHLLSWSAYNPRVIADCKRYLKQYGKIRLATLDSK